MNIRRLKGIAQDQEVIKRMNPNLLFPLENIATLSTNSTRKPRSIFRFKNKFNSNLSKQR
jgi:hypothetical protein